MQREFEEAIAEGYPSSPLLLSVLPANSHGCPSGTSWPWPVPLGDNLCRRGGMFWAWTPATPFCGGHGGFSLLCAHWPSRGWGLCAGKVPGSVDVFHGCHQGLSASLQVWECLEWESESQEEESLHEQTGWVSTRNSSCWPSCRSFLPWGNGSPVTYPCGSPLEGLQTPAAQREGGAVSRKLRGGNEGLFVCVCAKEPDNCLTSRLDCVGWLK